MTTIGLAHKIPDSPLFGPGSVKTLAENTVDFVVQFNSLLGFDYALVGIGTLLQKRWASRLALLLAETIAAVTTLLGGREA